jgi:hypothetical protein
MLCFLTIYGTVYGAQKSKKRKSEALISSSLCSLLADPRNGRCRLHAGSVRFSRLWLLLDQLDRVLRVEFEAILRTIFEELFVNLA